MKSISFEKIKVEQNTVRFYAINCLRYSERDSWLFAYFMIKINSEKLINQNLICKKHRFKQLLYILNFITQSLNIFQSF